MSALLRQVESRFEAQRARVEHGIGVPKVDKTPIRSHRIQQAALELFARTPVAPGDKVLEVNGTDYHEFKTLNDLKKVIKDEMRITIVVLRKDPEDTESSASSVDYDDLEPVTADGKTANDIEERDDDTVGYDGEDCGCIWCPDCHG